MILQAHRDSVRVVLSDARPVKSNIAFHKLSSGDPPLQLISLDTNVWALAITSTSSLIVTETAPVPVDVMNLPDDYPDVAVFDQVHGASGSLDELVMLTRVMILHLATITGAGYDVDDVSGF